MAVDSNKYDPPTPVTPADNTAWILTRRGGWSQQKQTVFLLPIVISDSEHTSTSTLTISVCTCDREGKVLSCSAEAYSLPASLSTGALITILASIFVLLGEPRPLLGFIAWIQSCRLIELKSFEI